MDLPNGSIMIILVIIIMLFMSSFQFLLSEQFIDLHDAVFVSWNNLQITDSILINPLRPSSDHLDTLSDCNLTPELFGGQLPRAALNLQESVSLFFRI